MTITFQTFLFILIIHYLADFVLQTPEQSEKKSTSLKFLTYHVLTYSAVWFAAAFILVPDPIRAAGFAGITFATHWIIDFSTSRIGKVFWDKKDYHNGFNVVGADQILHYVQLYWTIYLINLP